MDFLNKAYAQLAELFRSMSPAARVTTGLLLVAVVASLAFLFNAQVAGPDSYLLGGNAFSSAELQAMQAAFGKAGLSAYKVEGAQIRIPGGQQAAYMGALADANALPANFGDYLKNAVESANPFESPKALEQRMKVAKQREVGDWIQKMKGVESAAVIYDEHALGGLNRKKIATASVAVKMIGTQDLDDVQVLNIRQMVAGAFAALDGPEKVTVTDLTGTTWSGGSTGVGGMPDEYTQFKRQHEEDWREKIQSALTYVRGATVAVNVVLDREKDFFQRDVKYDPKSPVQSRREESRTNTSEPATPAGRPGLEAQGANQAAALVSTSGGNTSEETEESTEERMAPSMTEIQTKRQGLTPQQVTVSVGVPKSYFEEIWRKRNPTPDGQTPAPPDAAQIAQIETDEIAKMKATVVNVIPQPTDDSDPLTLVSVVPFEDVRGPEIEGPAMTDQAITWFGQNWSTMGMIGLAGFSLVMLRSMVRSAPALAEAPAPRSAEGLAIAAAEEQRPVEPAGAPEAPKPKLKRRALSGPNLRDELAEMVREDPDAAASVLRGWIGSTG